MPLLTTPQQADILSETGGPCVCQKPLGIGGTCANEEEWLACAGGKDPHSYSKESLIV